MDLCVILKYPKLILMKFFNFLVALSPTHKIESFSRCYLLCFISKLNSTPMRHIKETCSTSSELMKNGEVRCIHFVVVGCSFEIEKTEMKKIQNSIINNLQCVFSLLLRLSSLLYHATFQMST